MEDRRVSNPDQAVRHGTDRTGEAIALLQQISREFNVDVATLRGKGPWTRRPCYVANPPDLLREGPSGGAQGRRTRHCPIARSYDDQLSRKPPDAGAEEGVQASSNRTRQLPHTKELTMKKLLLAIAILAVTAATLRANDKDLNSANHVMVGCRSLIANQGLTTLQDAVETMRCEGLIEGVI
jgi:hypothetical protein